jgi:DNA-binding IclR family transcriptional regulator
VRQAEPLVEAISGVTGLMAQVYALVGRHGVVIASAGASWFETPAGLGTSVPLFATAAGKLIAAQLDASKLDALLPPEPFPDPAGEMLARPVFAELASRLARHSQEAPGRPPGVARTRRELDVQLDAVRREGVARDLGELLPEMGCLAMPWPRPALTAAIACMGPPVELAAREPLVVAVLKAAAAPAATRADVVAAASSTAAATG